MRILHTEASSGWGGQEIRILTEAQVFLAHGHEVMLVADVDSQIANRAFSYGVKVFPITLKKKRLYDLFSLRKIIKQLNPDLINCHSSTDHWLSALARLTLKKKPAIVRTRHISTPVRRNNTTRWLYNSGTEAIMTTGEFIRNQLIADSFTKAKLVFSVPTGINTDLFRPGDAYTQRLNLNLPPDNITFGIVATLRSWKGHSYLIQAYNKLSNPNSTLLIVGDGPQLDNCKQLARESPYPENIVFIGNKSDVLPYLQAMDCFILPSYANEGVPQAMLQAMAVGLPIISCPIGGIPETLEGYAESTLVPPQDANSLATAMAAFCLKPSANHLQLRATPFTLEKMYASVHAVFQHALSHLSKPKNPNNH